MYKRGVQIKLKQNICHQSSFQHKDMEMVVDNARQSNRPGVVWREVYLQTCFTELYGMSPGSSVAELMIQYDPRTACVMRLVILISLGF